ncbi:MAG TPA: hypothetical protein P5260_13055 [Candidatus Competibacter sp.]|nr:hypothetical protein [Candidatus Competibacter sp.]
MTATRGAGVVLAMIEGLAGTTGFGSGFVAGTTGFGGDFVAGTTGFGGDFVAGMGNERGGSGGIAVGGPGDGVDAAGEIGSGADMGGIAAGADIGVGDAESWTGVAAEGASGRSGCAGFGLAVGDPGKPVRVTGGSNTTSKRSDLGKRIGH